MSGEESFVILDCSPSMSSHRNSMDDMSSQNNIQDTPINCVSFLRTNGNLSICTQNEKSLHMESLVSTDNDKSLKMSSNSNGLDKLLENAEQQNKLDAEKKKSLMESLIRNSMEYSIWNTKGITKEEDSFGTNDKKTEKDSLETDGLKASEGSLEKDGFINAVNISVNQNNFEAGARSSLATSFILGEHNSNDLKQASLYSLFPNLMKTAHPEEVAKLQSLICEVSTLRQTCLNAERTTKAYYSFCHDKFQNLEAQIQSVIGKNIEYEIALSNKQKVSDENQKKLNELETKYVQLKDENEKLCQEVRQHNVHLETTTNCYQRDLLDMKQKVSEKEAIIANMRHHIEKMESGQCCSSWENINTVGSPSTVNATQLQEKQEAEKKELEELLKSLKTENENLNIKIKMLEAEMHGLQVNFIQSQEFLKVAKDDISFLQAKEISMRTEMDVMKHQDEVHYSDFIMERNAREQLASDREKLELDVRVLRQRIEELNLQVEKLLPQQVPSDGLNMDSISSSEGAVGGVVEEKKPKDETLLEDCPFRCPVCCKSFYNMSLLQSHVNDCLDNIK